MSAVCLSIFRSRSPWVGRASMCKISPLPSISTSWPGGTCFNRRGGVALRGRRPTPPQRAVFGAQSPQGESLDAEHLGGTHLVQGSHRVQEPDVVAEVIVVTVAEVRVERIAVKINVFFGIARSDPGFLHGNALVPHSGRQLAFLCFWPIDPVISIIADGADELFFRNHLHGGLKVG